MTSPSNFVSIATNSSNHQPIFHHLSHCLTPNRCYSTKWIGIGNHRKIVWRTFSYPGSIYFYDQLTQQRNHVSKTTDSSTSQMLPCQSNGTTVNLRLTTTTNHNFDYAWRANYLENRLVQYIHASIEIILPPHIQLHL